jgi:hypothetical protein
MSIHTASPLTALRTFRCDVCERTVSYPIILSNMPRGRFQTDKIAEGQAFEAAANGSNDHRSSQTGCV